MNSVAQKARGAGHPQAAPLETARAVIDPQAVAHNLQWLLDRLSAHADGHRPALWAVAKADAYGHGIQHVMPGLEKADGIAVLSVTDAYQLRSLGWRKPVLVINAGAAFSGDCLRDPILYPLHLVIDSEAQISWLEHAPRTLKPYVWLRFAGALHHAGLRRRDYAPAWRRLQALAQAGVLAQVGLMQHYARAEEPDYRYEERLTFEGLTSGMPGARCTENSAALLSDPGHPGPADWVRSGIALYGISPLHGVTGPGLGLRPAMRLEAPITAVQTLCAGQPIGYAGVFRASRDMRIGLVACGYACGYPRNLAENCPVLVDGRATRVVGRVSMDTVSIDLTPFPQAGPGTMATLWGGAGLPIETVAQYAGTIPAQLCSGLTGRVARGVSSTTMPGVRAACR